MKRLALLLLSVVCCLSSQAQNPELERLLQRHRNNPAIEYTDLLDSPSADQSIRVAETFDFSDSTYLVRHFVEDYKKIKGYKKLRAGKVLNITGNFFMKMALGKAISIRQWTGQDGYKDTVLEFDGCRYLLIHLGGYYEEDEIGKHIGITN